jgi:hypothetical protein
MGWKAFAVFAADQPGYFGTSPPHDPERADRLLAELGLEGYERAGTATFDTAMYPRGKELFVGAYPQGVILCHGRLPGYFFDDKARRAISGGGDELKPWAARLLALYPQGEVLAIVLHSVVNLWGYCAWSAGQQLRCAAGASDDGLIVSRGAPLPEEANVLSSCPIDKVDEEALGEELVFDVAARMLGERIDRWDATGLQLSEYRERAGAAGSLIKRLLRRG